MDVGVGVGVAVQSFLVQLPALLGVVVGALMTFGFAVLGDRARWRRDQRVRWDLPRLQAYADYGDAVKRVAHLACRVAVTRGFDHFVEPLPLNEGLTHLEVAAADRTMRWEKVLLLGDPDTIAAARLWHRCASHLEFFARGLLTDPGQWAQAREDFVRARAGFYRCARKDLGVEGADLPLTSWPPAWYQPATPDSAATTGPSV